MCGIVLVGSKSMSKKDLEYFEKLLHADTFRGPHSTGVFSRRTAYKTGGGYEVTGLPLFKKAIDGPEYLKTAEWIKVRDGDRGEFNTVNKTFAKQATYGNFYVGHNRWATVGAVNSVNAHPFREEHITMVHNGTLTDQSLLPDYKDYEVDSANVCHSLAKIGVDDTIQKLDGAFTLIWHNAKDDTLHIIRNEDRPFHLMETTTGDWFGASEEDMLLWIMNRGKISPTIKRHFETEVGVEYIFDVSDRNFELKEERKHELPVFQSWANSGWYGNYNRYSNYSNNGGYQGRTSGYVANKENSSVNTPKIEPKAKGGVKTLTEVSNEKLAALFEEYSFKGKKGDDLVFEPSSWEPYGSPGMSDVVKLTGYVPWCSDYVEVVSHNFNKDDFDFDKEYVGEIVGGYKDNGCLTVLVARVKEFERKKSILPVSIELDADEIEKTLKESHPGEDDNDDLMGILSAVCGNDDSEDETVLVGDRRYTRTEWEKQGANSECGCCGGQVTFSQADGCSSYAGCVICKDCDGINSIESFGTFVCKACGEDKDLADESAITNLCLGCFKSFYTQDKGVDGCIHIPSHLDDVPMDPAISDGVPIKSLYNGLLVTEEEWSDMNKCHCGSEVSWDDADNVNFSNETPICKDCESLK